MENKSKGVDFSFVKAFELLMKYHSVLLLIFGVFLFDSLDIMVFGKGITDTDFSSFFNLSSTPFFLLFFASFGVIVTILSSLVSVLFFKFCMCLSSKFGSCKFCSFFFNSKHINNENFIPISPLYEIALTTENSFLFEYIEKEIKTIQNVKKSHRVIYSLLISLIVNLFVTLKYNVKTMLDFIVFLYKDNGFSLVTVCLSLLLIPVIITICYGLYHSVTFDDDKIYYPKEPIGRENS